jgi:hypothetical protein
MIRRVLEAGIRTLPLTGLMFLPLLLGLNDLYSWTHRDLVQVDQLLQWKSVYLNVPAFVARALVYFAVWLSLAHLLIKWSFQQDKTADAALTHRLRFLSGPGILVYFLTMTFASVDWLMSIEPQYYSTIFGALVVIGQILNTLAFAVVALTLFVNRAPLEQVITPTRLNDLGNLLLAFLMLWAYMAFAQYLITWSGNLTEEIPWYLHRLNGGWEWVGLVLVLLYFVIPFLLLLQRPIKRNLGSLALVAGWVMLMRWVDTIWMLAPSLVPHFRIHWMDVLAPIGIGGVWLGVFLWQLKDRPLLPLHDPRLKEVLAGE